MLNRTSLTKRREEAEDDITFIVKNKSMPSACMHTSTRITYYTRGYKESVDGLNLAPRWKWDGARGQAVVSVDLEYVAKGPRHRQLRSKPTTL
jgi:hypothetical protein